MSEGNGKQERCQGAQLRYTRQKHRQTNDAVDLLRPSLPKSGGALQLLEVPRMHLAGYEKWHSQGNAPRPVLFVGRP
jgi:hypothetical protein